MATATTKVVFRRFPDGEIIALFPEFTNKFNRTVTDYMHIGQHGESDYNFVIGATKPAKESEYTELLEELRGIYKGVIKVIKRANVMFN